MPGSGSPGTRTGARIGNGMHERELLQTRGCIGGRFYSVSSTNWRALDHLNDYIDDLGLSVELHLSQDKCVLDTFAMFVQVPPVLRIDGLLCQLWNSALACKRAFRD